MRAIVVNRTHVEEAYVNALNSLGVQTALWSEQFRSAFDTLYEFKPDILICHISQLTPTMCRAILKNKVKPLIWVEKNLERTELINTIPAKLFTHLPVDFSTDWGKIESVPYGWDSTRLKSVEPFKIGYVGNYKPKCDPLIKMDYFNQTVKIFGNNWPTPACLGRCTSITECHVLSGTVINFNGKDYNDRPIKTLACGGYALSEHNDYLKSFIDGVEYFSSYEEMVEKSKYKKLKKIDMSAHTYTERMKKLVSSL